MKLKDETEVVVIATDHTTRTALEDGFSDLDVIEVGSFYHRPHTEDCHLPASQCPYTRHLHEHPACIDSQAIYALVRRSVAARVAKACLKTECFG